MSIRIAIIGMGRSGIEAARLALKRYADEELILDLYDESDCRAHVDEIAQLCQRGARFFPQVHELQLSSDLDYEYELGVISPGIPWHSPLYISAARCSRLLMSEVEFAWQLSQGKWIAVTGTNGKSTTTMLINHVLKSAQHSSKAIGNIGYSCSRLCREELCDPSRSSEYKLCELSSFQLYSTQAFAPEVGILLNIDEDHIAWHKSIDDYARSKMNLFRFMDKDKHAIVPFELMVECKQDLKDGQTVSARAFYTEAQFSVFSARHSSELLKLLEQESSATSYYQLAYGAFAYVNFTSRQIRSLAYVNDEQQLCFVERQGEEWVRRTLCKLEELPLKGVHNLENYLAALCAAFACTIDSEDIVRALLSFQGLEHRMEFVGEYGGCRYYNDSKATNPHAALQALSAFQNEELVLMLGGYDKGVSLESFAQACVASASCIVCFGAAAQRFYDACLQALDNRSAKSERSCGRKNPTLERVSSMKQAFELIHEKDLSGKVVLLSPACSSYDEFSSFEERGRVFKQMVHDLITKDKACM